MNEIKVTSYKVSVCVVSYNQEKYIGACLQSIVDQVCDFDFEIIVGDDASTDDTKKIISEFAENYPNLILPVYHEKNVGFTSNYTSVHARARGQYVAHIDGDDLMCAGKLQRQADYLDQNEGCNLVWHQAKFFNSVGATYVRPAVGSPIIERKLFVRDLLLYGSVAVHSSTMYRVERYFWDDTCTIDAFDWYVSVRLLGGGYAYVLEDVLGMYRLHSAGLSSGGKPTDQMRRFVSNSQLDFLDRYPEFRKEIAARALMTLILDALHLRSSTKYALKVLIKAKAIPRVADLVELYRFYKISRRSNI
ncbi:glycosyltransferase [Pseudomonas lurida]|uniref:glycosyltransferase family 2 protein n=1 Tax=Pseudomonas TaxID=286 RepID=UPI0015E3B9E7|nr:MULTISPECIES: glycosyltransferase family 2 protein [Pseudomonas]MBA1293489.1 glycosyltransferase [Pseudomonas lurida]MCP1515291.1 glycosyltransferase involved in cell wall biosynthesis [Pseudomonas rhodesiae]MDF9769026.1 glycosyltransferase involved in cell wall biosynthesis [Pseudomonas rhodesiae]